MGLLKNIFTWWEGASFTTRMFTRLHGTRVGSDDEGNVYFQGGEDVNGRPRRWVMYDGANDSSRVPPEWHAWLHNMIDGPPDRSLPPQRVWQAPASPNLTGTREAYRPAGALEAGGVRAAATGDYEAWSPDAA